MFTQFKKPNSFNFRFSLLLSIFLIVTHLSVFGQKTTDTIFVQPKNDAENIPKNACYIEFLGANIGVSLNYDRILYTLESISLLVEE